MYLQPVYVFRQTVIISSLIDQAEVVLGTRLSISVATIAFAEDTTITIVVNLLRSFII